MAQHDVVLNLPLMTVYLMKYSDREHGIFKTFHT